MVAGDYKKTAIRNVFKKMSSFTNSSQFDYDCIILDEAHRGFTWKFGYGVGRDVDMIDRLFYASKVNVFFVDEDQVVTKDDYLTAAVIKKYAAKYGSTVIEGDELSLKSQFRCIGGENYIAFINSFLGYNQDNVHLEKSQYDFRVFDSPSAMRDALFAKQNDKGVSRIVAGNTYEWNSVGHGCLLAPITIFSFQARLLGLFTTANSSKTKFTVGLIPTSKEQKPLGETNRTILTRLCLG